MEIKVVKEDKKEMDIEIESLTIAEILRVYLNKESSVNMAAWKREHPSKPALLHIEADNPKKAVQSAVREIEKDLDKLSDDFKKSK